MGNSLADPHTGREAVGLSAPIPAATGPSLTFILPCSGGSTSLHRSRCSYLLLVRMRQVVVGFFHLALIEVRQKHLIREHARVFVIQAPKHDFDPTIRQHGLR